MDLDKLISEADSSARESVKESKYDPEQSTLGYFWNQAKLIPPGILGLPMETIYNIRDLLHAGTGAAYIAATGKPPPESIDPARFSFRPGGVQSAIGLLQKVPGLGFDPTIKPPGPGEEFVGDVQNTALSIMATRGLPKAVMPRVSAGEATTFGVGAATGKRAAEAILPDTHGAAEMGELAGGLGLSGYVAPRVSLIKGVVQTAISGEKRSAVIDEVVKKYAPQLDESLRKKVTETIVGELRDDPLAAKRMVEAQNLLKEAPGVKLDIGQSSEVGGIVQRIAKLVNSSAQSLNEKVVIDRSNRQAISDAVEFRRPGDLPVELERVTASAAAREAQLERMIGDSDAAMSALASEVRPLPAGQTATFGGRLVGVRKELKINYDSLAKDKLDTVQKVAGDSEFAVGGILAEAANLSRQLIGKYGPENIPAILHRINNLGKKPEVARDSIGRPIDEAGNVITGDALSAPKSVPFAELRAMREVVNQDISDAAISPFADARQRYRALVRIKSQIDRTIKESGNQPVQDAYGGFLKFYREEYAPKFLKGINLKQALSTSYGEPRIPVESLLGQYLKPNGLTSIKRFIDLYGTNQEAMQMMRDAAVDRYASQVVDGTGRITEDRHAKFMRQYGGVFQSLKEAGLNIEAVLNGRAKTYAALAERKNALSEQQKELQNDAFLKVLQDKFGNKSVDQIMPDVIKDQRIARGILAKLGRDGANGMVNWFADDMASVINSSAPGDLGIALSMRLSDKNYLGSYRQALVKAIGEKSADAHIMRLSAIERLSSKISLTEADPYMGLKQPLSESTTGGAFYKAVGFTARTAFNLYRAMIGGRTSEADVAFTLGGQAATYRIQLMMDEISRKLIADPEFSKTALALMQEPPGSPGHTRTLKEFIKKSASLASHWTGFDRYGEVIEKSALGLAVQQAQKQEQE